MLDTLVIRTAPAPLNIRFRSGSDTYLTIWYHTIVNLLHENIIFEYLVNIWWASDQLLMYKRAGSMLVKKDLAPQMLNTRSSLHVTTFLIRPKLSLYFLESFLCHMQTFFSYNSLFSFSHQCLHQHKKFKIVFFPFLWYFFLYDIEKFMENYTIGHISYLTNSKPMYNFFDCNRINNQVLWNQKGCYICPFPFLTI